MKWIKRLLVVLLILIVVAVVAVSMFLGDIVKKSVETALPGILGVPVTLEDAGFSLLRGKAKLKGLVIGNPEGYETEHAFAFDELSVDVNTASVFSDTIEIKRIYIGAPKITFEKGLKSNNIKALLDGIGSDEEKAPEDEAEEEPAEKKEGGKRLVINDFIIEDAQVKLSLTALQGIGAPVPLPTIHLKDIGKDEEGGGASPREVMEQVMGAILASVTKVAGSAVDLVGKGAKQGVEAAGKVADEGVKAAGKTVEAAGEVAGEAVGAVGDVAGEAAGAAKDTADKLIGGMKGLLGGKKKSE